LNGPISGPVALQIESLNETAATNLAGSMILSMIATAPSDPPGERVLKGLHQILMFMLLEKPGEYRECEAIIFETNEDTGLTTIARHAPAHSDIAGLMAQFFDELAAMWPSADALDIAAYALWAICWMHPFEDGNGRAARAFAYVCLSVKTGRLLPGAETFFAPSLWREGFYATVHKAHVSLDAGSLDLSEMRSYLGALVKLQAHVEVGRRAH
jgi:hypothetical protein